MPMVGGKKFPYTEKGKAAAKKEKEKEWEGYNPSSKNTRTKLDYTFGGGGKAEGKRMMDKKKTALKNRLKSKGMK